MKDKKSIRLRRARRTRSHIRQLGAYRLSIHRTPQHIYAQIIAPDAQRTVVCASTLEKELLDGGKSGNIDAARKVGALVASRAKEQGITKVAFDRSGFQFHGRVKALAEAAREAGLEF
ncbi:50S ribosomal protein L18 [Sinimarinibacterium sp. NLF-5-8]|uniref:50S ribosomal protein L18 n=1 Tax=Sinimarinibacterium sp. NLF-5-8 TaxID=2698684 RepID=UPI00137BA624|nr:50S ribosomal protein L18 [Sinimarinibacterium sp. NLF-5-8]QHS11004.1 50S ribosomal protein L18 [Sinimarinibacterium sp. NLF-5-8]